MEAIRVEDVTFRYFPEGKRNILEHANLTIPEGGITVLTGDSGCGKSTLAAVIAGLYPENGGVLTGGRVELFGKPVSAMRGKERAETICMMFQNPDLQFCMNTLRKELLFCMENICVPACDMDRRMSHVVELLHMQPLLDRKLDTLSGGEKQKAALCCMMVLDSRILVLDEPFANIDTPTARQIIGHLQTLAEQGKTILAIDHRPQLWQQAADRILCLGTSSQAARSVCRSTKEEAGTAVELREFTICRETPLLEQANADFPKGKLSMILGDSGSGKTTTFLSLLKQHPYLGTVRINGRELRKIRQRELFSQVGVVFQNPGNQFITQNVLQEVQTSLKIWKKEADAEKLLEDYSLWQYRKYSPYMLSQGQQRRLAVLSVLCGGQKILLLDEPTYGQDSGSTAVIMEQLQRGMENGLTVICITHDEDLAHCWADKIYRLEGRKLHEA